MRDNIKAGSRVAWITGNAMATAEWEGTVVRADPASSGGYLYVEVPGYSSLAIIDPKKVTLLPDRK